MAESGLSMVAAVMVSGVLCCCFEGIFVNSLEAKDAISRYLHRWELDAALDVITMCSCHLPEGDPVVQMRQDLLRYKHILSANDHYCSWQEVEAECKEDPEGLALRLAGKGAVNPHCAEACNNLGVIYNDCDNLDKAMECYQAKL
ncbi:putative UDP-N-acetylglucosamine--peptide N-acetylglucosaminyltransferase SPINDLY [Camellia lanceoleosa]|uniref:UDP-N-acetylglucosamine--peptide N-acetylglucosaminyltransferase SPINDLY n=1 Tax=Camellia lanceoleosa TaxID=1840588 RepID=A0ACC0FTH9_9ERIC|nr:putative UDP-N-acetylglucosamine--peptide N-acetylglucosaminyltransferase SPINDLY [Camellia lanceoleosa]